MQRDAVPRRGLASRDGNQTDGWAAAVLPATGNVDRASTVEAQGDWPLTLGAAALSSVPPPPIHALALRPLSGLHPPAPSLSACRPTVASAARPCTCPPGPMTTPLLLGSHYMNSLHPFLVPYMRGWCTVQVEQFWGLWGSAVHCGNGSVLCIMAFPSCSLFCIMELTVFLLFLLLLSFLLFFPFLVGTSETQLYCSRGAKGPAHSAREHKENTVRSLKGGQSVPVYVGCLDASEQFYLPFNKWPCYYPSLIKTRTPYFTCIRRN